MNNKVKFGLSKKMLLSIIILGTFICVASCIVGYRQYQNTIHKLYNENGYIIGEIILDNIPHDLIESYSITWKHDDNYAEMKGYLDRVCEASNAKYIYIVVPYEDGTMRYIYDSSGYDLGAYDPVSKFLDEILEIYNTGIINRDNYFIRNSPKYGSLTSSVLPVKNAHGDTVALLFVDIAMELIRTTLRSYIFNAILISVILMLVFCQICYVFMNKTVITPINLIEKCLNTFAHNNAEITDDLKNINTKDELSDLSFKLYDMEESIVQYISEITNITAEKERIGAELNVAKQIQANMLPSIFPPFPEKSEFDIYATMHPAKEVGGDFYDFFMIDDTHIGIVMADVSGKGVPAALFMVVSKTLIKNRTQMGNISPSEVLSIVNNQLCENNKAEMFVTVWLGILDINTGIITAANAGHEYPAIKHNGKFELLKDKHGFVLAGMNNLKYKDYEIKLEKGDALFVYTDGVAEATNVNNELFGTDRMLNALNLNTDGSCDVIINNVNNAVNEFVKDAPQFDDITMLCLEYYGRNSMKEIKLPASIENVEAATEFVNSFLEDNNCSMKAMMQIDIAIDELFSNIANYAYGENAGDVYLSVDLINNSIASICFKDKGVKYNPLEKEDPDITLSASEREIGGLGIFLVKKSMDSMEYEYKEGYNILTITKTIV